MIKEFCGHDSADQMMGLSWSAGAAAVPVEAREGIGAAGLQFGTEDIDLTVHGPSVATTCTLSLRRVSPRATRMRLSSS